MAEKTTKATPKKSSAPKKANRQATEPLTKGGGYIDGKLVSRTEPKKDKE